MDFQYADKLILLFLFCKNFLFLLPYNGFIFPFMTEIPDNVKSCTDYPVEGLCNPDTKESHMEGNTDQIRQCNSNEPHGQDADRHRKLGIAGRTS